MLKVTAPALSMTITILRYVPPRGVRPSGEDVPISEVFSGLALDALCITLSNIFGCNIIQSFYYSLPSYLHLRKNHLAPIVVGRKYLWGQFWGY